MSEVERLPSYSAREGPLWRRYLIDSVLAILGSLLITGIIFALHLYAEQASRQARETRILYELVRATNNEEELESQLSVVVHSVVNVFSSWGVRDCAILLPDANGKLTIRASAINTGEQLTPDEEATASWVMKQAQTV